MSEEQKDTECVDNLYVYKQLQSVPEEAKKKITAGRLKNFTDINPMWRLKKITEMFGVCGVGWKYEIKEQRLEVGCKDQISAFVTIDLYVKIDGRWSEPIPGVGGSSFISSESKGLYQSDECFKMALTDAISVSTKALGLGADVYFEKDMTKHNSTEQAEPLTDEEYKVLEEWLLSANRTEEQVCVALKISSFKELTKPMYEKAITALKKIVGEE